MGRKAAIAPVRGLCQPEPVMSIALTVSDVLRDHVNLELECIDRMYLNVYVPQLQRESGVASFLRFHLHFLVEQANS